MKTDRSRFCRWVAFAILAGSPLTAKALESHFLIHQTEEKSRVELRYMRSESSYRTLDHSEAFSSGHHLGVRFHRGLSQLQSFWVETEIVSRKVGVGGNELSAIGLGDIHLGYKNGSILYLITAIYGVTGSLSPGPARDLRLGHPEDINNFSGAHSLAPFAGLESYWGDTAIGAQAEVRLYSDFNFEEEGQAFGRHNDHRYIPKIRGFLEVPLGKDWKWGTELAISRAGFALDQLLLGGGGNEYEANIYGEWRMEPRTSLLAQVISRERKYPLAETSLNFSLALLKEM